MVKDSVLFGKKPSHAPEDGMVGTIFAVPLASDLSEYVPVTENWHGGSPATPALFRNVPDVIFPLPSALNEPITFSEVSLMREIEYVPLMLALE